jgi:hypothetical protein
VMYSARAGIVSRTVVPPPFVIALMPDSPPFRQFYPTEAVRNYLKLYSGR